MPRKSNTDTPWRQKMVAGGIRRRALDDVREGILRLLPVFLLAAVAVAALYALDTSREDYVSSKGDVVEINDNFITISAKQLSTGGRTGKELAEQSITSLRRGLDNLRPRRFSSDGTKLADALAEAVLLNNARDAKDKSDQLAAVNKYYGDILSKLNEKKFSLEAALEEAKRVEAAKGEEQNKAKAAVTRTSKSRRSRRSAPPPPQQDSVQVIDEKLKTLQRSIDSTEAVLKSKRDPLVEQLDKLRADAVSQVDLVHAEYKPKLPAIIAEYRNARTGVIGRGINLVFDEGSNLHVIYQIFKVTALVILVVTALFVVIQLFRTLSPLGDNTDTVAEQLKALLAGGAGSSGRDVARTAIASLAALGVGTAGAAAYTSVNDKADRALALAEFRVQSDAQSQSQSIARVENALWFTSGGAGGYPLPSPSPISTPTVNVNASIEPPLVFNTPVVRVIPSGGGVTGLTALTTSVNEVRDKLDALHRDATGSSVGTWAERIARATETLGTIDTKLGDISTNTYTLTRLNSNLANTNTMLDTLNYRVGIGAKRETLNDRLNSINEQVLGLRQDNQFPLSTGRNWQTRLSQFFRGEKYLLTEQSVNTLSSLLPEALVKALRVMKDYKLGPTGKDDFVKELKKAAASNPPADSLLTDDRISLILTYARVPR